MNAFVQRHQDQIIGILNGFDRILFRGTLRSISYVAGLDKFLGASRILLKDFAAFAKRCTDQLAAHAQDVAARAGRPYIYLACPAVSKEDYARTIAQRDHVTRGLVCVLAAVEPCMTFDIRRNRCTKHIELVARERRCRFFYFYFIDREFGLMHVRLQSWIPFSVQVCINGRAYLARQLDREGITYERRGNCFVHIQDFPRAQALIDRLVTRKWVRTLARFAQRVNPLLNGPLREVFGYYWTARQSEYATDVLFKDAGALNAVYPGLCRHAITHFHSRDVMRFLGYTGRGRFAKEVVTHMSRRIEGVRIKHWVNQNSLKMYDKEGCILRIETTINNPRSFRVLREVTRDGQPALAWQKMRKGICDMPRRAQVSLAANSRYLEALSVVGQTTPSHRILDSVSRRVRKRGYAYRALRPISPEDTPVLEAVMQGEHLLNGFTNRHLQSCLFADPPRTEHQARKRSAYVSRKLRLLRAHGLIRKVSHRRLHRITDRGHRVIATALIFRETDLALLNNKAA